MTQRQWESRVSNMSLALGVTIAAAIVFGEIPDRTAIDLFLPVVLAWTSHVCLLTLSGIRQEEHQMNDISSPGKLALIGSSFPSLVCMSLANLHPIR